MASPERFPNLVSMFFTRAAEKGARPFLWYKARGAWKSLSWADAADQVSRLAAALRALALERGDRVMLVSESRPEWGIADLAIMAAGGVTVPAYTSNTPEDHRHILDDSGARMAIVSTAKLARPLLAAIPGTFCETVIGMEALPDAPVATHGWDALLASRPADPAECAAAATFVREDLACLIYTSGTGGRPRGVCQHHGAILHNAEGAADIIRADFDAGEDELLLSMLPLSHAYEHSAGLYLPIMLGAQIAYAESLEKLAANMEEVRPTVMIVVPRLFELLRARTLKAIARQGRVARWLLDRALALDAKPKRTLLDRPLDLLLDRTIRRTMRARFGGRLKALVSGGAPLNPEVGRFFRALGLTLLQGYGETESGPIVACNRPAAGIVMETVGPPLANTDVRIADDGEILVRGENVMHGYWNDAEETARVLMNGWLHTGDVGHIDGGGRIRITDRKKDLIVNDKGENISPQRVEGMLALAPEIAQAMVVGDRRPYLVGLVVPEREWALTAGGDVEHALMAAVDRINKRLSITERVRRIAVADEPFTIENKELTPSLKIRRHVLKARYGARLDALYAR